MLLVGVCHYLAMACPRVLTVYWEAHNEEYEYM
jgi:hypothetical protein